MCKEGFGGAAQAVAAESGAEQQGSSMQFFETNDFRDAAQQVRAEPGAKRESEMQVFETDDFKADAEKVRSEVPTAPQQYGQPIPKKDS